MAKICALILFVFASGAAGVASAKDLFLAESSLGSGSGSDCPNALPRGFFNIVGNWGSGPTQIGPGTTVHLCGTFAVGTNTTAFTFQGSGTSGNPVTLLFEKGATLTSAAWPQAGGAIDLAGRNFVVIDGGTDGTITATANGSGLANQLNSRGIQINGSHDIEIKNLRITNLYRHTSSSDIAPDVTVTGCIYANGVGSNLLIHDNIFADGPWCINLQYNGIANNVQIYRNDISRVPHGITLGASGGNGRLSNVLIYGNHIHDFGNWGTATNTYHLTGVHIYGQPGSTISTVAFSNNFFDGTWGNVACPGGPGGCITAFVFIEGGSSSPGMSGLQFFNNVGIADAPISNGLFGIYSGNNSQIYNNTMIGSTTTSGVCFGSNTNLTGVQFLNNVMTTCNQLVAWTGSFASGSPDYNIYADGGGNAFQCVNNFYSSTQFTSWQACAGSARDSHSSVPANAGLDRSNGLPQTGSATIGAGANLSSLGIAALSLDRNGVPRPSVGPWDVGAFMFTGALTAPNPPTNLKVQ